MHIVIFTGLEIFYRPTRRERFGEKMYPPFEDKGKIFTDIVRTQKANVVIHTTMNTTIHGHLHVRLDNRLKDELDMDKPFVAITDAIILDPQGNQVYKTDFIAVNRSQIVYIFPINEPEETGSDS